MSGAPSHYKFTGLTPFYDVPRHAGGAPLTERTEPFKPQPCNQLPADARNMLVRASQVYDLHGRRIAIDTAIDFVRLSFPTFFRHPQPEKD